MAFDINEVVSGMIGAVKGSVGEGWPEVKSMISSFMQSRKARLELLATLRLTNQLSDADVAGYLEDEKLLLDSELHNVAIISKAIAQRAANAAIDVLQNAILSYQRLRLSKEDRISNKEQGMSKGIGN
jgi:hypothetical protein